jgi:hypothetical protein
MIRMPDGEELDFPNRLFTGLRPADCRGNRGLRLGADAPARAAGAARMRAPAPVEPARMVKTLALSRPRSQPSSTKV